MKLSDVVLGEEYAATSHRHRGGGRASNPQYLYRVRALALEPAPGEKTRSVKAEIVALVGTESYGPFAGRQVGQVVHLPAPYLVELWADAVGAWEYERAMRRLSDRRAEQISDRSQVIAERLAQEQISLAASLRRSGTFNDDIRVQATFTLPAHQAERVIALLGGDERRFDATITWDQAAARLSLTD